MTGGGEAHSGTQIAKSGLRLFVIAGEHSGDALGAKLLSALAARAQGPLTLSGVGGDAMAREGLTSLYPISDVAVMGPVAILKRLPQIMKRVYQTVDAAVAFNPDAVVIIDSPEFTHPIAKRIKARRPDIPVVDYVSPSVWAWRPGRAKKMRAYVDHVLALLPFEPEAHQRLGGPPCTYVGHPLIEKLPWIRDLETASLAERLKLNPKRPVVVVLPGSRPSEVQRLMEPFGDALREMFQLGTHPDVILPVVESVRPLVEAGLKSWPFRPALVSGDEDKFRAFKLADVALAASGTVTLELALAGVPMVVAYKVEPLAVPLKFLIKAPSIILANLVLGEKAFPEFIQERCTGELLGTALADLTRPRSEARLKQHEALARIPDKMDTGGKAPSEAAADVVLEYARAGLKRAIR